jgi:hypothetical protein
MAWMTIAKPPYTSIDDYHKVMEAVGTEPDGLHARYVGSGPDGVRVVAIWESQQHAQRFLTERLAPALAKVLGPEPQGLPEVTQMELADAYVAGLAVGTPG